MQQEDIPSKRRHSILTALPSYQHQTPQSQSGTITALRTIPIRPVTHIQLHFEDADTINKNIWNHQYFSQLRLLQTPSLCPLEAGHSEGFCIVFLGALNPWTVWHVLRSCFLQMAMAGDTNTARFCAVCADGRHSGRFLPNRPFHALLTNSPAMAGHRRSTRR